MSQVNEPELLLFHTQSVYGELHPSRDPQAMRLADGAFAMGLFLERQTVLHIQRLEKRIKEMEAKIHKLQGDEPV